MSSSFWILGIANLTKHRLTLEVFGQKKVLQLYLSCSSVNLRDPTPASTSQCHLIHTPKHFPSDGESWVTQWHSCQLEKPRVLEEHRKLSLVKILLCFIDLKIMDHLQMATGSLQQTCSPASVILRLRRHIYHFSVLHEKCQWHLSTECVWGRSYVFWAYECSLYALDHTDKILFPLQAERKRASSLFCSMIYSALLCFPSV